MTTLSTADCLTAIETHSAGLAAAARDHLDAPVEHCPGWSVADLVWHLTEVHWFWATIAGEKLSAPPDDSRKPPRPPDAELVTTCEAASAHLVEVLGAADQSAFCWTWAPWQQDVAFVTRHQVQEAAVHHWDAAHATGAPWSVGPGVAADCLEEFCEFSLPNPVDEDDPPGGTLGGGTLVLRASDTGEAWTLTDHERAGTVAWARGAEGTATVEAPVGDLLLWLYERRDLPTADDDLAARLRGLSFTD